MNSPFKIYHIKFFTWNYSWQMFVTNYSQYHQNYLYQGNEITIVNLLRASAKNILLINIYIPTYNISLFRCGNYFLYNINSAVYIEFVFLCNRRISDINAP
jgi:hypothetical protein